MLVWSTPTGRTEASIRKVSTSGSPGLASGAVISTCWSRSVKPTGSGVVVEISSIVTSPAFGVVTDVPTGSFGVTVSLVDTVPPAGAVADAVLVGGGDSLVT